MLSMQNSPLFAHADLTGSGLQDEGCSGPLPNLPHGIHSGLRASTSSTSTGASPDDTSTDSPDWHGGDRSPPADLDISMNAFTQSDDYMLEPQMVDMDGMPKVEELDEEDIQLESIKPSDVGNRDDSGAPAAVPRKRGRPRKHPLPAPGNQAKITKGRSKTGCITCRRRKKKCDETKPA